jgi:hypothetical protein
VQIAVTAIILWFVGLRLVDLWKRFQGTATEVHPRWDWIAVSCAVVLLAYVVLIETWRRMVVQWGERVGFADAAAIWFTSALVRYVPGNVVVQLGAFAELARRRNVSPATAAGAAVINTVVNLATGFVVAFLAGWSAMNRLSYGNAALGLVAAAVLIAGLLALPSLMPRVLGLLRRLSGRTLAIGALPRTAVYQSLAGNLIAWALYGLAFQAFVFGVLGQARGTPPDYIAVWASSYVIGYLALALPAGIGIREITQTDALTILGLATVGQGAVVAITARLWMTLLEIVPALVYLLRGTRARHHAS